MNTLHITNQCQVKKTSKIKILKKWWLSLNWRFHTWSNFKSTQSLYYWAISHLSRPSLPKRFSSNNSFETFNTGQSVCGAVRWFHRWLPSSAYRPTCSSCWYVQIWPACLLLRRHSTFAILVWAVIVVKRADPNQARELGT